MSEEENEKRGFRVVDRRRFNAEGELKPEAAAMPDPKPAPMPPPEAPRPPAREAAPQGAAPTPRGDGRKDTSREPPARAKPSRSGVDFISFVAQLATQALAAMGAIPEARAQGMPVNFDMAREYIAIIDMLQEKTEGNLAQDEAASLTRLLSELKMTFVEMQRRGGHPGA